MRAWRLARVARETRLGAPCYLHEANTKLALETCIIDEVRRPTKINFSLNIFALHPTFQFVVSKVKIRVSRVLHRSTRKKKGLSLRAAILLYIHTEVLDFIAHFLLLIIDPHRLT